MPGIFVFILLILYFITLFSLILRLVGRHRRKVETRMAALIKKPEGAANETEDSDSDAEKSSVAKKVTQQLSLPFQKIKMPRAWKKKLAWAGSSLSAEEYFVIRFIMAIGMGLLSFLFGFKILLIIGSGVLGFFIPSWYMSARAKKRLGLCGEQLAEALGTMANGMRAGFSFMQAMQMIGKEMGDPLGPEFDRVIKNVNYGVSTEEAFHDLSQRLPLKELELVINGLLIQRKNGGNLAELLETMQETIHGRVRLKEELHTLTAQGRLSSWIISLLPVAIGFYLYMMNRQYFGPMLNQPLGIVMLVAACVMGAMGWILIRKIVNVEV